MHTPARRAWAILKYALAVAVIAGVCTRHYYRKLGYHLEGPYMVKLLAPEDPRAAADDVFF